ncbi:MAG TPA: M20/M25/M40 family metallo-hydrolase [Candidatus Bathyarchaeia archaeon]|nr:M20/M25/M40 family metallo-hydrolase [Candidatus Bathyarchaeia archaeon]
MRGQLLKEIEAEATSLLSNLIRIDTTNPPGNETAAATFLAENLSKDGFECEIIESAPGRGNILTRLKGATEKPSLLLLSHLDVVPAKPEEWSVDPFGGVVKDGFVWGRAALDMKSMTVIEALTMKLLKRNNVKLKSSIILAATADEEKGGLAGADYLLRNQRSKIFADYVLNEGGGLAFPTQNRNVYTVQTAEKGILWFKIIAKGIPGHGSTPDVADNAIIRMNKVIEKLTRYRPPTVIVPTMKRFLNEIAGEDENLQKHISRLLANPLQGDLLLDELAKTEKLLAEEIRPRIRMTIAPTVIHGGVKENVIPSECEATFDCRILPGQATSQAFESIKELLKEVGLDKLTFEIIQANEPSESSFETPLSHVIIDVLRQFEPNCGVTPLLMTGGTDSRFFRQEGSICYGFHPMLPEIASGRIIKREHGVDERISVENLVFGTSVLYEVVKRFMSLE